MQGLRLNLCVVVFNTSCPLFMCYLSVQVIPVGWLASREDFVLSHCDCAKCFDALKSPTANVVSVPFCVNTQVQVYLLRQETNNNISNVAAINFDFFISSSFF